MPHRCLFALLLLCTSCAAPPPRPTPPEPPVGAAPADATPTRPPPEPSPPELARLTRAFRVRTGAQLVFTRSALPPGPYYDVMPELSAPRRRAAAAIALREAEKYPPGYLGAIGVKAIGIFDGLAAREGDGYRPYDEALGGYRYFGQWNGRDAIVAAYYSDEQLPLTLHHEVFHHVDATDAGRTDYAAHFAADDAQLAAALGGASPYPALELTEAERAGLVARGQGSRLRGAVSDYAGKSPGEDQAETARYLMSHLPDALLQAADEPALPGSQRILHVLHAYQRASRVDMSPGVLVGHALGAPPRPPDNPFLHEVDEAVGDRAIRAAIRAVQPAAVRLEGGSGVNVSPAGLVLTAGHVPDRLGRVMRATFPDGKVFSARCVALDLHLDLALMAITGAVDLPIARLAERPPVAGTTVVVVGQPGTYTPGGEPTGYQPFHVSVGAIRGFLPDPLGSQRLGRTKHDAWTYWGHSGSPLFDRAGRIVALHNSWDSQTAMRHAVTHEAIADFLRRHRGLLPASTASKATL